MNFVLPLAFFSFFLWYCRLDPGPGTVQHLQPFSLRQCFVTLPRLVSNLGSSCLGLPECRHYRCVPPHPAHPFSKFYSRFRFLVWSSCSWRQRSGFLLLQPQTSPTAQGSVGLCSGFEATGGVCDHSAGPPAGAVVGSSASSSVRLSGSEEGRYKALEKKGRPRPPRSGDSGLQVTSCHLGWKQRTLRVGTVRPAYLP